MGWVTLAGVIITFIGTVISCLSTLVNRRKINEVHVLVDGTYSVAVRRNATLTTALEASGVDVPPLETQAAPGVDAGQALPDTTIIPAVTQEESRKYPL
jgi:hypothetical protein